MNEFKDLYDQYSKDLHTLSNEDKPIFGNINTKSVDIAILIGAILAAVVIYRQIK